MFIYVPSKMEHIMSCRGGHIRQTNKKKRTRKISVRTALRRRLWISGAAAWTTTKRIPVDAPPPQKESDRFFPLSVASICS